MARKNTNAVAWCTTPGEAFSELRRLRQAFRSEGIRDTRVYSHISTVKTRMRQGPTYFSFRMTLLGRGRGDELRSVLEPIKRRGLIVDYHITSQ